MSERAVALRNSIRVTDPFTPVRLAPVEVNGTSVPQVGVEILNDEGRWECANIHSQGYQLIPNSLVLQVAREILGRSSLSWTPRNQIWTGRFLSLLYQSDQIVEVPEVGDAIALGLRIENSYDGSARFRMVLMAYVLSCANGLMSPRHFTTYTVKHVAAQEFDVQEATGILGSGVSVLEKVAPRIAVLSKLRLTVPVLSRVANGIDLPNRDWGAVLQHLGQAKTVWDLMQEITHQVTHFGRGRALLGTSEAVGDYFLGDLAETAFKSA